ncbi:MAG: lipoprotein 17-related variable surface protein [Treponema lecithinolyticum]|uniref:lipoprotein 17-related variable surface protein n=1 Tax=Treponema lecithinolyticum TaxID=53418 RepID=UPI00361033C3
MKHTTKLILPAVLIFALSLTGCPQAGTNPGENSGTNPAVPSNPNELVESDVLTAFGLTKGTQSAFEAAEKITSGSSAVPAITFTQKNVTDYDDQAGTFTVKVKGTKNGKPFEKELTFSGFSNPYAANPQSMDTTGGKGELKLDEGIEHNHSIEKYTGKAKNLNIANFFQAPLTFSLVNGTSITLGDFSGYKLTAALVQEGNDKVKIVPEYTVKNHKKIAGGTPTVTEETKYSVFPSAKFAANFTKPYFTEKDVFAYVLSKTNDSVIKVYPNEFASSFYAFAKIAETAPGNLFDTSAIDPYTALYQTKDTDEYMQLDITCGIHDPKNGGIDADDYKGELTVRFCIATHEQLANKELITAVKLITRSGYASIPDNAALAKKDHLFFNLIPKAPLSPTDKTKWRNRNFSRSLLRINESGAAIIDNPFSGSDSLFYLFVNSSDPNPAAYLGSAGAAYGGASKTKNNKVIFIEHIQLEKKLENESLEVQVTLKGSGSALKVTAEP